MDILGVLIEPLAEAWGEEEVSATTLLLVNCFCKIGLDYQYTILKKELNVHFEEDEMEDGVDIFEEKYNAGVESGTIIE